MYKIFVLLILMFGIIIPVKSQDKKALMSFEKGQKDFSERNYQSALENFNKYLEKDSSKTIAIFRIGQIYESFRNVEKASAYYKKVIEKDTNKLAYVTAYTYLGSRALERGEFQEAKKWLDVSQKYSNKNAMVYQQILRQQKTADFGILALANPLNIKPEALPKEVNHKKKQYFPVLTADNNTMIFTSRNEDEDENIYFSTKNQNVWSKPISISENINSPFNEGTCSISADGKIMVFTSCEGRQSFGSCDLYISKKENNVWSKPENLGAAINSNFWDSQPSLSSDGSRLFFSSERPFGQGKKDIWMSELDTKGQWKKATNLGKEINTAYDEVSPFMHANGQSLFFSSNGKEGMGSFDIFMSVMSPKGFGETINLGYPINTSHDEISLFISADGQKAFYSVDKNQDVQLYTFDIPEKLASKINKTYYIKGYVLEQQSQKPLYASLELIDQRTGAKLSKFMTDPITGDYMAILPGDGKYVLYVETPEHFFKSLHFDFTKDKSDPKLNIELSKIEKQKAATLENIYFDSGSANLRPESNIELTKLKELLEKNKTLKTEISGHTDDVGNDAANLELSKKRAASVMAYLQTAGIGQDRLVSIGHGETKPKVKNTTEPNRQINRRIEFKFL
jgi:outer membrane protein OmpA-like peptidoglycan-associated protein